MACPDLSLGLLMARKLYRLCLRCGMALYLGLLSLAHRLAPQARRCPAEGGEILMTGTFYSENWLRPHLEPLAMSTRCRRLRMVATAAVPRITKVEAVYPPAWLIKAVGAVPSRLLVFSWLAIKDRPHVIGGFHLLLNGLFAILLAKITGARSLYLCGGGPREVLGGGFQTENRIFSRLGEPDPHIESQHLQAVRHCDIIVAMGSSAARFFHEHGVTTPIHIMPGGFSTDHFHPAGQSPSADLITVGRISNVKRIDLLLHAVHLLRNRFPHVSAIVVGDGPMKKEMEQLASRLGLTENVRFVGQQENVGDWLRQARIFVMTSDSEGVSQAMIQAMLCGLPAVVSHVGDLGDVVMHGESGFLVADRTAEAFAKPIEELLRSPDIYTRMSQASLSISRRYGTQETSHLWDPILEGN